MNGRADLNCDLYWPTTNESMAAICVGLLSLTNGLGWPFKVRAVFAHLPVQRCIRSVPLRCASAGPEGLSPQHFGVFYCPARQRNLCHFASRGYLLHLRVGRKDARSSFCFFHKAPGSFSDIVLLVTSGVNVLCFGVVCWLLKLGNLSFCFKLLK